MIEEPDPDRIVAFYCGPFPLGAGRSYNDVYSVAFFADAGVSSVVAKLPFGLFALFLADEYADSGKRRSPLGKSF